MRQDSTASQNSGQIEAEAIEYKPVVGIDGYLVGSDGTVWTLWRPGGDIGVTPKPMKLRPDKKGYIYVALRVAKRTWKRCHVARLVLQAFVGRCPEGMEACHFPDRDPANNRLDNLRWDTRSGNFRDKVWHGTQAFGEASHRSKYTDDQVMRAREMYADGCTQAHISRTLGITAGAVQSFVNGRTWAHLPGAKTLLRKGIRRGKDHWNAKVGDDQEREIRNLYAVGDLSQRQIGEMYGVSQSVVGRVCAGVRRTDRPVSLSDAGVGDNPPEDFDGLPWPHSPGVRFRPIGGYPGYCVGDDGSVWTRRIRGPHAGLGTRWRKMKPQTGKMGHCRVRLWSSGSSSAFLVHHLVLEAFVGPRPDGMVGCHSPDRDPRNNRLNNIRWGTRTENEDDAKDHGTRIIGERHPQSKLTEDEVREIRRMKLSGLTGKEIGDQYGLNRNQINKIASGKSWAHVR